VFFMSRFTALSALASCVMNVCLGCAAKLKNGWSMANMPQYYGKAYLLYRCLSALETHTKDTHNVKQHTAPLFG